MWIRTLIEKVFGNNKTAGQDEFCRTTGNLNQVSPTRKKRDFLLPEFQIRADAINAEAQREEKSFQDRRGNLLDAVARIEKEIKEFDKLPCRCVEDEIYRRKLVKNKTSAEVNLVKFVDQRMPDPRNQLASLRAEEGEFILKTGQVICQSEEVGYHEKKERLVVRLTDRFFLLGHSSDVVRRGMGQFKVVYPDLYSPRQEKVEITEPTGEYVRRRLAFVTESLSQFSDEELSAVQAVSKK